MSTDLIFEPKVIRWDDREYATKIVRLLRYSEPPRDLTEKVAAIIQIVRADGDDGLLELTYKFDHVKLTHKTLSLTTKAKVPAPSLVKALKMSLSNIHRFSKSGLPKDWQQKNAEGALVGEQFVPFQRVGIYIPGGTAPLLSTVLMTVGIAKLAGVPEIVVATPPPVDESLHYAISLAGATEIYQLGGAQAIAALAYGTDSIKRVQKIIGPGNQYVVEAKRQVTGVVSIDLMPGPSEIAILADDSARSDYIASDLLAQAEHGHGGQALFVTTSQDLLDSVLSDVRRQLPQCARQDYLQGVMRAGATFVLVKSLQEGIRLVEDFAPEHLTLITKNARPIAKGIRNSGAIFIGNYSPVAAGDYVSGANHTLPTGGAARSFSGLAVDQFFKRTSIIEYSYPAIKKAAPVIETLAHAEQLDAHAKSAMIRLR